MKPGNQIRDLRKLPWITLTLSFIITAIHMSRMVQSEYNEVFFFLWGGFAYLFDQPWRIVTTALLHNDLMHLFFNLAALLLLGWYNERKHGWRLLLGLFFGAVIVSGVGYLYTDHNDYMGISGFTVALFGFSLVANRRQPWWKTLTHNPIHLIVLLDTLRVLIMDQTGLMQRMDEALGLEYFPIAHFIHLFGGLYGLAFAWAFTNEKRHLPLRLALVTLPALCFASLLYSPWLLEWRLVKWGPILTSQQADCSQASIEGITPASFSIKNDSDQAVAYYWLPPEGKPVFYGVINPHDSEDHQAGYLSYAWCVVDADTQLASLHFAQIVEQQSFTLQNSGWHALPPLPSAPTLEPEYQGRYIVVKPTVQEEAEYVWFNLQELPFYDQNGYTAAFPDDPVVKTLMQKARDHQLEDEDYASLLEAMNRVYNPDDYENGYQKISASLTKVEKVLPTFEEYNRAWGFKVFPIYTVLLTLYGPGGSYDPQSGVVLMQTGKNGLLPGPPADIIIHESVHMGIESFIEQYSIEHWVKERIVDRFVYDHFHPLLPLYQLQQKGDQSIDEYLDSPGAWDKLPEIIKEYKENQ